MKAIKTTYWISTGLFAALMLMSGLSELFSKDAVQYLTVLGYPAYLNCFLGVAKLLGVVAILQRSFPRLKEWAYAGFTFDLGGATYSMMAVGLPVAKWSMMFVFFAVLLVSYIYYRKVNSMSALPPR